MGNCTDGVFCVTLITGFGGERSLNDDPSVDGSIPTAITDGASTYESMEQWAARHTESHARSLARLERRRDGLLVSLFLFTYGKFD